MIKALNQYYRQLQTNRAFFLPTIGIYLIITIGFITIQTINVLSLEYAYKVKENILYQENAFAHAQYAIVNHRNSFVQSRECLTTKNQVLNHTYNGVSVNVTSQCHKVPLPAEPDELSIAYDGLKTMVKGADTKMTKAAFDSLKSELTIINDLEFVEDAEDAAMLVITMGASSIEYAAEELEEMTFQDWIVYETDIKTASKNYQIITFYHQNINKVEKVVYTV